MSPTSCQTAPPRARRNVDSSWPRNTVSTICDEKPQPALRFARFKGVRPMIEFGATATREFLLEPGSAFLNHGSFGAPPRVVLEAAEQWRQRMEANADLFLREILPAALREAAAQVAVFIRANPDGTDTPGCRTHCPCAGPGSPGVDRWRTRPGSARARRAGTRRRLVRRELSQVAVCSAQLRVSLVRRRGKARAASARDFPPLWGRIHGGIRLDRHAGLFGLARGRRRTAFSRWARSGAGAGLQP